MDAKAKGKLCADKKQKDAYASIETIMAFRAIEEACEGEDRNIATFYTLINL